MSKVVTIILIFIIASMTALGQQVELATQKGHSASIEQLEFSKQGGHLLSWGINNEGIIWDLKLRKALTRVKLPEDIEITGIKFTNHDRYIKIQTPKNTYLFNIHTDRLTKQPNDGDTLFRKKQLFYDPDGKHKTFIEKGTIKKKRKNRWFPRYWLTVSYTHAEFYAFDVSREYNLLVGVAANNVIYCHDYKWGREVNVLLGHNSAAMDVRFSHDERMFATAGKDRSIIIWDTKTRKKKFRLYSNIFRKNTATFSHDGNQIHVGDELGNLFSINFDAIFPATTVVEHPQSINKIQKSKYEGTPSYLISNSNNGTDIKQDIQAEESLKTIKFRQHELTRPKGYLLQNLFGFYQKPIGEVKTCNISPDGNSVLLTGETDLPNITYARLDQKKIKHYYAYEDYRNWKDAQFLNNEDFVSILDNSGTLYLWENRYKDLYFKKDSLPFMINHIAVMDEKNVWISSIEKGQYTYNIESKELLKMDDISANNVFYINDRIAVSSPNHDILFIDPEKKTIIASFKGHTERITDISFHPDKNVFISSSDDGTIKLWNYKEEKLIASIIPVDEKEVMIITADNYYLISKGAMDEIGFRYEGQFFYPDQFDLKYNRPDLVLEQLGYTNDELIKAYHRAYKKRLKKLNFTEEALSGDFHLPELEITNKSEIPIETDNKEISLDLLLRDEKDKLESYKVWINDVAVLSSSGKSIRHLDTSSFKTSVPLRLGYGDNKVEVSVLNQSGAQSYKEVVNVKCTRGKEKPDAYIVSIGVSKYKDNNYNLAYATKDAVDIQKLFNNSEYFGNIHTKSLTDEEVVLESLDEIAAFLNQADVDDFVMVFIAGHGVLDENFDYYFASYDMDFSNPSDRGIPYKRIEELVDGIKALKKLLILDTCHSGELDKEEIEARQKDNDDLPEDGKFRNAGTGVAYREDPLGFENINFLMKQVFLDLRRGTGATVISSSGGTELAFESPKYENGLFTYSLIDALESQKADVNKDDEITISELQSYLIEEVKILSNGKQVPTSRIHNKEMDYRVW